MLAAILLSTSALAADVDLRLGVGIYDLAEVYVGVAPAPSWDVHATVGTNLGLVTYFMAGAGAVVRPWRWDRGANHLALGLGPDLWVGPAPGLVAVIGAATLDGRYERRRDGAPVGLVLGSRWSLGATTDVGGGGPGKVELAAMLQPIQVGISF